MCPVFPTPTLGHIRGKNRHNYAYIYCRHILVSTAQQTCIQYYLIFKIFEWVLKLQTEIQYFTHGCTQNQYVDKEITSFNDFNQKFMKSGDSNKKYANIKIPRLAIFVMPFQTMWEKLWSYFKLPKFVKVFWFLKFTLLSNIYVSYL